MLRCWSVGRWVALTVLAALVACGGGTPSNPPPACMAGLLPCGGRCIAPAELLSDRANCGMCGRACGAGQACALGMCEGADGGGGDVTSPMDAPVDAAAPVEVPAGDDVDEPDAAPAIDVSPPSEVGPEDTAVPPRDVGRDVPAVDTAPATDCGRLMAECCGRLRAADAPACREVARGGDERDCRAFRSNCDRLVSTPPEPRPDRCTAGGDGAECDRNDQCCSRACNLGIRRCVCIPMTTERICTDDFDCCRGLECRSSAESSGLRNCQPELEK